MATKPTYLVSRCYLSFLDVIPLNVLAVEFTKRLCYEMMGDLNKASLLVTVRNSNYFGLHKPQMDWVNGYDTNPERAIFEMWAEEIIDNVVPPVAVFDPSAPVHYVPGALLWPTVCGEHLNRLI